MIPYIVALVFLIVIVLYQVFSSNESFTAALEEQISLSMSDIMGLLRPTTSTTPTTPSVPTAPSAPVAQKGEYQIALSDLFGLLGPFSVSKLESEPAPYGTSLTGIEDRIATAVSDKIYDKCAPCKMTDAEAQGQEFGRVKPTLM